MLDMAVNLVLTWCY